MGYELIIAPEAQDEINEAVIWYESRQQGLGSVFLDYLEGYFETIKSDAISFPIKGKPSFRELALKKFPFIIIYEIHHSIVIVYSVFHTHQDPSKKRR